MKGMFAVRLRSMAQRANSGSDHELDEKLKERYLKIKEGSFDLKDLMDWEQEVQQGLSAVTPELSDTDVDEC